MNQQPEPPATKPLESDIEILTALRIVNDEADRELARYDHTPGAWSFLSDANRARLQARADARAVISRATTADIARAEQLIERRKPRPSW